MNFSKTKTSKISPSTKAHNSCPAWKRMKRQPTAETNRQRDEFTNGPQFKMLIKNISERLGYKETIDFGKENTVSLGKLHTPIAFKFKMRSKKITAKIRAMYEMCRFEAAWFPEEISTWCTIFSKEDLKILEYREDLNYYYCCGPGQEMAPKFGCLTLGDMFGHFE